MNTRNTKGNGMKRGSYKMKLIFSNVKMITRGSCRRWKWSLRRRRRHEWRNNVNWRRNSQGVVRTSKTHQRKQALLQKGFPMVFPSECNFVLLHVYCHDLLKQFSKHFNIQFSKFSKMNLFQSISSSRTLNGLHNLTWQLINSEFFCRKVKEFARIPWPFGNKGVNRVPYSIFIWIYVNICILSRFQGYILHFWKAKI